MRIFTSHNWIYGLGPRIVEFWERHYATTLLNDDEMELAGRIRRTFVRLNDEQRLVNGERLNGQLVKRLEEDTPNKEAVRALAALSMLNGGSVVNGLWKMDKDCGMNLICAERLGR